MALRISSEELCFEYRKSEAKKQGIFKNLTFELQAPEKQGHIVSITGASGCGKSTLLKLISGELTPTSGKIRIFPETSRILYQTQTPILFNQLSIKDNAYLLKDISSQREYFDQANIDSFKKLLDMDTIFESNQSVEDLSGGEKQRLALLRSLSVKPEILLLDEPCNGLDETIKFQFLSSLREIANMCGMLILYVTHNPKEIHAISDDVAVLDGYRGNIDSINIYPLKSIIDNPSTISDFRLIYDGILNEFDCSIRNKNIFLKGYDYPIGKSDLNDNEGSNFGLSIPSQSIKPALEDFNGIEVFNSYKSGSYRVFRLQSENLMVWSSILTNLEPAKIRFEGNAFVFDKKSGIGKKVQLNNE
jgi:NitT/TauT family transport system ATP-binding protein